MEGAYMIDGWHHFAIVYGQDAVVFYLNGVRYESDNKLPWRPDTAVCLQLAGWRGRPHNRFTGLYDDVRVYGKALSDSQVAELANSASDFYTKELLPPIANAGIGYTAWLKDRVGIMTLDGGIQFAGQNGDEIDYKWEVVTSPDGARAQFRDPTKRDTDFAANQAGTYKLRLTASNAAGSDAAIVNATVFVEDPGLGRPAKLFAREPWSVLGIDDFEPSRPERVAACKGLIAPIAYWTFDETEGATANATGTKASPIALDAATMMFVSEGKVGGALNLQPQKNRHPAVDFGSYAALISEFSLAFWLKSDRTDKRATLFSATGANDQGYWSLSNQHNKGGLPQGYSAVHFGEVSSSIHLGQRWNHVVVTYSDKADFRKIYINGHLVGSRKFQGLNREAAGEARLVFNGSGLNYCFRGLLDEVAIYDVTLNNEEVWTLFEKGVPSLTERIPEDPYKTGAYRRAYAEKWFPELKPKPVKGNGFAEARFDAESLPPYTHPRLFFTVEDLPRLRAACRSRDGNRVISQLQQYSEIANQGNPDGSFKTEFSMDKTGSMLAEAYVTLLEADTPNARRVIDWMMACAEWQKAMLEEQQDKLDDWQHSGHGILLRYGTPLLYDWMYNWMTSEERDTIRQVIAACTRDRWSIGMYGHPAWSSGLSNWQPWLTGEMMLALQSIYREDGFDPVAYEAASRATALCALLMADEESGASYEGMAKNNMQLEMYALVSRTQPRGHKLIGSQMPYNHVAKFLFHNMAPWGGEMMKDDALGGMSKNLEDVSVAVMHYAYPDDPIINYMKHNTAGRRDTYSSLHLNTFSQNSPPMIWSFVQDWEGPTDLAEHLKQAVAEAEEPLGYFSNYRGLMIGRSDWTPDALQLYFQPRCLRGGHPIPARGYFRLSALGRIWVPFNGAYPYQSSEYHSVVTVDGVGQDNTVGKVLSYHGAAEDAGALVDIMGSDLIGAYRQTDGRIYTTHNEPRLYPDTERPWMGMDKRFLVHWWRADRPSGNVSMPAEDWAPKQDFAYAYRTAALVRGQHPFVLIVDDIKKDEKPREYNWSMMIPRDIFEAKSYELTPQQAILTDPKDNSKRLLVLPIGYRGDARFDVTELYGEWRDKKGTVYKLNFRCQSKDPAFRMLLYPYMDGDPLPKVSAENDEFTITVGDQIDRVRITAQHEVISKVEIERP